LTKNKKSNLTFKSFVTVFILLELLLLIIFSIFIYHIISSRNNLIKYNNYNLVEIKMITNSLIWMNYKEFNKNYKDYLSNAQ
jgi:predicted PurR-regulated permease PerM